LNNRKLLQKIVENWPAKVLSVAIALALFVFHRMSTMSVRPFSVPLSVETSVSLVPTSSFPHSVKVQLRGEEEAVKSIIESDIEAYVDFAMHEAAGSYRAPVQIRRKGSALNVEPLEISVNPLEIAIQLDQRITKTLPLAADIRGRVAAGFDLVSSTISPQEVVVSGPMGILDNILELKTNPIELDGRRSDFIVEVNIVRIDPLIALRGNGMAVFQGLIRPSVPVRTIEGIPIALDGLDPRFAADIGAAAGTVRLEGGEVQLDAFLPAPGFLSADCSSLSEPGTYTLPVTAALPFGFTLIMQEPSELSVTIFIKDGDDGHNPHEEENSPEE